MKRMKRSEFIEKWLEALESGEYKQVKKELYFVDNKRSNPEFRFCCLGVACDVANKLGVRKIDIEEQQEDTKLLPKNFAKFIGIATDGSFREEINHRGKTYNSLSELNDDGVKFKTIARIIRENLASKNFYKPG